MSTVLNVLLSRASAGLHVEYGGFLSSHVTHGLIALSCLGADDKRLEAFFDAYTPKLEPIPRPLETDRRIYDAKSAVAIMGGRNSWCDFRGYYEECVQQREGDLGGVIREHYPPIMHGMSGAALHTLIQLGYALYAKRREGVVDALAYHGYAGQPGLDEVYNLVPTSGGDLSITDVFAEVQRDGTLLAKLHELLPTDESKQLRIASGYVQARTVLLYKYCADLLANAIARCGNTLRGCEGSHLVDVTTALFCLDPRPSWDFFLLHGVTAAWSLQQVLPHLNPEDAARAKVYFGISLLAIYIIQEAVEVPKEFAAHCRMDDVPPGPEEWGELKRRAVAFTGDEHVAKLVQVAALRVEEGGDNTLYTTAAHRVLRWGDTPVFEQLKGLGDKDEDA